MKKDPVTGGSYESELRTYMRYHGLSLEEATQVLETKTHVERDIVFAVVMASKLRKEEK